ncbi:hypothetical protein [Azomonas macrocytogenes]|uniref:Flagellar biosynthesis/type III secretory pathway M-ring protein FliF/YscJ n=1 Tax=Azomonas macrocytogenes TaxID=69962 RepID=A0A839T6S0_AZOMA|nr:hypothetical protein [Azomonas macrocytogenes]MBB3103373.1 flagellar biosynthesis/type III secretory pathway M-ring protein FliF/YscJ [Azomonas macrocytogenes]
MDTLWIVALAVVALILVAIMLHAAAKPRRFKPKSEEYWKEQARRMQKRYTGQVIGGEAAASGKRRAKAGSVRGLDR